MRKLFLSVLVVLLGISVQAQITLSNAHFPQAGDKLYVGIDTVPFIFVLNPSPTPQFWNFQLVLHEVDTLEIQDAASGMHSADFPNADIILPFFNGEGYAKVHNDSIEILGFFGSPVSGIDGFNILADLSPDHTTHYANMTYGSTYWDDAALFLQMDGSEIPDIPSLPVPTNLIDSARLWVNIIREDTVDAWGTMITPSGSFDVLRVKETEYRYTELHVKYPILGWVNVNNYNVEGLGNTVLRKLRFMGNVHKEPVAEVELRENDSNRKVTYYVDPSTTVSIRGGLNSNVDFDLYPNPATDRIHLKLDGLDAKDYTLRIFDVLGREVLSKTLSVYNHAEFEMNVEALQKGTYMGSIINEAGQVVATKQFVIK